MSKKQLWILAGGNGAGKSTFYRLFLKPKGLKFVNADLIAAKIFPQNPENASYKAAYIAEKLRYDLLDEGCSFCFETVFSHISKVDFAKRAKSLGYEVIIVYIHLKSDELNIARVAQRVSENGHSVPSDKIRKRIPKSVENIKRVLKVADIIKIYDNSSFSKPYEPVAEIRKGKVKVYEEPLPLWAENIISGIV